MRLFNVYQLGRSFCLVIILGLVFVSQAWADSCPYCGQVYGDPAPGDQARVYGLRREHEAVCRKNSGAGSAGSSSNQGLLDAFSWGLQQGQIINQQMQQQAMNDSTSLNNLGVEYGDSGDYDTAIKYCEQALQRYAGNTVARQNLNLYTALKLYKMGSAYFDEGKWAEAAEALNRAEQLHHVDGYEMTVNLANERFQEEQKNKRLESQTTEAAHRVLNEVLASAKTQDSPVYAPGSSSGLEFLQEKEPLVSKGDKDSAPAALKGETPQDLKEKGTEKGLKINEPPTYSMIAPPDDPYSINTRAEIILDALKRGDKDWDKSINILKGYLISHPHHVKVQQALSYIEGMRARVKETEPVKKKGLFDPDDTDSQGLLDGIPPPKKGFLENLLSKEEPPSPKRPKTDRNEWLYRRTDVLAAALKQHKGDTGKTITYLENKVKADENDFDSINALQYLEGYCGYADFVKEHRGKM